MMSERGAGDLASVSAAIEEKLIRRHPHIFADAVADTPAEVKSRWERIKVEQEGRQGIFHDVPASFPALLLARKLQQRAGSVGFDWDSAREGFHKIAEEHGELAELFAETPDRDPDRHDPRVPHEVGDLLFAVVNVARLLHVDPELALREAARRFERRVIAAAELAAAEGLDWTALDLPAPGGLLPARESGRHPMTTIIDVQARQILDSRGNPTVEVEVELESGVVGRAAVPSGASTGEYEAVELRDDERRLPRQGRAHGRRQRQHRHRRRDRGLRRHRPAARGLHAHRAGRHAEQGQAGRQRHPRRVAGHGLRRRGRPRAAAVPVHGRLQRARPAGAHDEHHERRQARRQQRRPAGVHDHAGRRRQLRGGAAHLRRGLPRPQGGAARSAASPRRSGDEGGFAPDLASNEEALRVIMEAIDAAGYEPGDDVRLALDPAASSFFEATKASTYWPARAASSRSAEMVDYYAEPRATSTPSSASRTVSPRTTGTASSS